MAELRDNKQLTTDSRSATIMSRTNAEPAADAAPEPGKPNVKWVGVRLKKTEPKPDQLKEDEPEVVAAYREEPPKSVHIGMLDIELPSEDAQRAGFYSAHAFALVSSVPGYKLVR